MNNDINLVDYYKAIKKRYKFILSFVFIITCVAIAYSLTLPRIYLSKAVILVSSGGQTGGLSMALQSSGINLGNVLGGSSSSSKLMALLDSRTFMERIINRFHLIPILLGEEDNSKLGMEYALNGYKEIIKLNDDKKRGTLSITVELPDPKLSASVANGILDELQKSINSREVTFSKKQREFIGNRLVTIKKELLKAGKDLAKYYDQNRISSAAGTVDVMVDPFLESGPAQINEVFPSALDEAENKLKVLNEKMNAHQNDYVHNVPQRVYLEYLGQKRETLKLVDGLLSQQYEMAKIEEAKEAISYQIIDYAQVPQKQIRPHKKKIVMATFLVSFFVAVLAIFGLENMEKSGWWPWEKLKEKLR